MNTSLRRTIGSSIFALILMVFQSCTDRSVNTFEVSSIDQKVDSLLSIMTLEEKIGQTNMYNGTWEFTGPVPADNDSQLKAENIKNGKVGGLLNVLTVAGIREAQRLAVENSRLSIPLIFGYDVIHGYKTMLPVPIAQAASWDIEVARKSSELAAKEASAAGLQWTFSPMIDVSRDSRWGRIMESAGEDPYLTSAMAKGWVEGYQGDDLSDPYTIAACAKHFAGYGFAEAGREYNTVDVSMQTLYNVILPPFEAAKEAGAVTFMNAFNDLNGIPATGNEFLQRSILKDKWAFEGFVVSDWASLSEMIDHGFVRDTTQAARLAMKAGSDMDMEGRVYEKRLKTNIDNGEIDVALLDDAVRRILKVKYRLGLFDDPYRYCDESREKEEILSGANLQAAREIARKTFVLLKNENKILPLSKEESSIAVIGQLGADKDIPLGSWRAQAVKNSAISLLEGIRNGVDNSTKVEFEQGYTLTTGERSFGKELSIVEADRSGFKKAILAAHQSKIVILALGEDCFQSGEGRSQMDIRLKGSQIELFNEIKAVNDNIVVVLMTGRPVAIPEIAKGAKAILQTWHAGSESGNAIADVLFGDFSPIGKLPASFPVHSGQEPLYYNRKSTGRPVNKDNNVFWSHYTDGSNEALFPFGFGLTYTKFSFHDLEISLSGQDVKVTVDVTNEGERDGVEVAQLYIQDVYASLIRPILELKNFKRISVAKGQTEQVEFILNRNDLSFFNNEGELIFEPGEFKISVGSNSRDLLTKSLFIN